MRTGRLLHMNSIHSSIIGTIVLSGASSSINRSSTMSLRYTLVTFIRKW